MAVYKVKRGLNIKLAGGPASTVTGAPAPTHVALTARDFLGVKPGVMVEEGDPVKAGQPLFFNKGVPEMQFCSPGGGTVTEIRKGYRRAVMEIVVELSASEAYVEHAVWDDARIGAAPPAAIRDHLLAGGLWPMIRQRPLAKIADPGTQPVAVFINGMDTAPLAADPDLEIIGRTADFQRGVQVLSRLCSGAVHLCLEHGRRYESGLQDARNVTVQYFRGPHPAGVTGVHIRRIGPLKPGTVAWYLTAADVVRIGEFFRSGRFPVRRIVAVAGTGITAPVHLETRLGVAAATLLNGRTTDGEHRLISGNVLTGTQINPDSFVGFYDNLLCRIPESDKREFMGWGMPGFNRYSSLPVFASALIPRSAYTLDTRLQGGRRPIVNIGAWDRVFPFDIHLSYLVRAILAEDLEEAESLGLLELSEEDVALCTFVCPSKMELGSIIRQGLDLYERES